jgi:5'-nucleotidase/UDP-sugar diphosphatase
LSDSPVTTSLEVRGRPGQAIAIGRIIGRIAAPVVAACGLAACSAPPAAAPAQPPRATGPVDLTILFTSDEHGWILPHADHDGEPRLGGAAEVLAQWVARDGHCPGPPDPPCPDPHTLALSGGDNATGPAISSYFGGAPMADAMARMGYTASALGNHELDFGRPRFTEFRARSHIEYLAANLRPPPQLPDAKLPAFAIYERRGIKLGVVGLATDTTLQTAMASLFEGITFEAEEPALVRATHAAWAAGADAVIAIAHECPDVLAPIVERHPDLHLAFVGAGHCHRMISLRAAGIPVISPGARLEHYVRVRLTVDAARPAGARVTAVDARIVGVPDGGPAVTPDPVIVAAAAGWKVRLDAALGEKIGYAAEVIDQRSAALSRWITDAWRIELGADVGLVNSGAIRQSLPRGPITKSILWSIMPFDNKVVVLRLRGKDLIDNLENKSSAASGVVKLADGRYRLEAGPAIDPDKIYSLATIDYLYFDGAGYHLHDRAVSVDPASHDWREPVIAWTRKQASSEAAPLVLRPPPVP